MWFFILFFYLTSEICHPRSAYALTDNADVQVSASIGENEITLNGYSFPNSPVELEGINIYSKTYSDNNGYFEFNKIVLPKNPSELCLTSTDSSGRQSTPVCIPPPPATNYHTDIGPIILPPTISLEQDQINPNATVISSGQSIPNSPLTIFFYKVDDNAKSFSHLDVALAKLRPKAAMAYSLPPLKTTTDKNGNYNLNLPTAYSSNYRLYTAVEYNNNNSPKSNTLLYFMPKQYNYFMIYIFIFTIILFFLLLFVSKKYGTASNRSLPSTIALYPDYLPRTTKIPR